MINVIKLTRELMTAGIPTSGCNTDGIVWVLVGRYVKFNIRN